MIPVNVNVPLSFSVQAVPLTAQYRVSGPAGIIQDWTSISVSTENPPSSPSGVFTVVIPADLNIITTSDQEMNDDGTEQSVPAVREARVVDFQYTAVGVAPYTQTTDYIIGVQDQLVLMQNSFQTYPQACELASYYPNLQNWPASNYDARVNAMTTAFRALSRLGYEIIYDQDSPYFRMRASYGLPWYSTAIGMLYNYTADDFAQLDWDFQQCLCRAQVIEADDRLATDPLTYERENGVLMVKTAETSHTYRNVKPLRMGVCKAALKELQGYVKYGVKLARSP